MKLISLIVGAFITLTSLNVVASEIPLNEALSAEFNKLHKKTVKFRWYGGTNGTCNTTYDLGVSLPAGALITDSYFKVIVVPVDGGANAATPLISFKCEDASNILAAVDLTSTSINDIIGGASYGNVAATVGAAAAGMVDAISGPCQISSIVTRDNTSAGEIVGFVEYVDSN